MNVLIITDNISDGEENIAIGKFTTKKEMKRNFNKTISNFENKYTKEE